MEIIDYFQQGEPAGILSQIQSAPWSGAASLFRLLDSGTFFEKLGPSSRLLVLMDGDQMAAFCTLAERDDIPDTELRPWIGYVYTSPQYRGRHCAGQLISSAESLAAAQGYPSVHISTGHKGLYEKYGYGLYKILKNKHGEDSRVYCKNLETRNQKTL